MRYKSKTASGHFYLVDSGETVAEYGMDVTFFYDTSLNAVGVKGSNTWTLSKKSGWKVDDWDYTDTISNQYVAQVGIFGLSKDNRHNNTAEIRVYCDHYGNITLDIFDNHIGPYYCCNVGW
ncbi:hypothetical protein [Ornithinibacillus sp. FSL M8-0202]|uniref:hypothetical protein n=1 Tax=unclassified Ornithinibacillus TaxID=2620869 RepID=UPI0030D28A47